MIDKTFPLDMLEGEEVLWKGQPCIYKYFSKNDFFLIPFSILWGGGAISWEVSVLNKYFLNVGKEKTSLMFSLFGIPFVIMGLYLLFGRFIYKVKKKRKTWYIITNKRIMILCNFLGNNMTTLNIDAIHTLVKSVGKGGIGSIIFLNANGIQSIVQNAGLDLLPNFPENVAFYDVADVASVHQLMQHLVSLKR